MKNTRLYDLCKRSLPDYINVWKQLVNVDCGSRNGKGINAVADVLIREFEKISPYSIEKIPMENPEEGCHLLVVFRGKGKGKIMADLFIPIKKKRNLIIIIESQFMEMLHGKKHHIGPALAICHTRALCPVSLNVKRPFGSSCIRSKPSKS